MNAIVKTGLIALAVYVGMKVLDRMFLNEHVWSKLPGSNYEDYEDE